MRGQEASGGDPRPAPSKAGQAIRVGLNTYDADISDIKVYQYEVLVGNGVEKRGLVRSVWESKAVNQAVGQGFIFDGNRLAWSLKSLDREVKLLVRLLPSSCQISPLLIIPNLLQVDLDQERGRTPRPGGKDNKHRVMIKCTNRVRLDTLVAYMAGKCTFDNACLEAITFLNHALREYPSLKYTTIKQSFFARGQQRFSLGGAIEAFKGVYSSMRIVHTGPGNKGRLSINIDVANGTFWTESLLHNAAVALTGKKDVNDLITTLQKQGEKGRTAQDLKKMRKLHVVAKHRGVATEDKYVIDKFVYQSARNVTFEKDGKNISIYDYFAKAFHLRLSYPDLPLVKMTKVMGPQSIERSKALAD
jgi:eukaryotic translation initiation factor 2C